MLTIEVSMIRRSAIIPATPPYARYLPYFGCVGAIISPIKIKNPDKNIKAKNKDKPEIAAKPAIPVMINGIRMIKNGSSIIKRSKVNHPATIIISFVF
jgi:hypothetical protein